jgi:predicted small secreted protein
VKVKQSFNFHCYYLHYPVFFEENIMKKLVIASLAAMFVLTGCNTFKGLGQDVSSAGDAVSGSAQEVQNKI